VYLKRLRKPLVMVGTITAQSGQIIPTVLVFHAFLSRGRSRRLRSRLHHW